MWTSIRLNHGVYGPDDVRQRGLRQRFFPQESPESDAQRSIVSLRGELDRDPVLVRGLQFSHELWEEDPGVQKKYELAATDRRICLYRLVYLR